MTQDYAELQQAIESAGFFTTFQPTGDRIVCASHRYPEGHERQGLYGNNFWVALRGQEWYVGTYAPSIYRVTFPERLKDLCVHLLQREGGSAYGDLDEDVRRAFGLVEVSDEDFDRVVAG